MPWLASPFGNNKHLASYFNVVKLIPSLVLLDAQTGDLIKKDAKELAIASLVLLDAQNGGLMKKDPKELAKEGLTFRIHGLKNKTQWNGRECSISFDESTKQLIASVKISLKEEHLKPKDKHVMGKCDIKTRTCTYFLKVGMDVIVYNTQVPQLNETEGKVVTEQIEGRYIVLFQFPIFAKNLNLVL